VNHLFKDAIADKIVGELNRNDFLELQERLNDKGIGPRTINRVMQVLKIAFRELHIREKVRKDPTFGVDQIHYDADKPGVFTAKEL